MGFGTDYFRRLITKSMQTSIDNALTEMWQLDTALRHLATAFVGHAQLLQGVPQAERHTPHAHRLAKLRALRSMQQAMQAAMQAMNGVDNTPFIGNDAEEARAVEATGGNDADEAKLLLADVVTGLCRYAKGHSSLECPKANLYAAMYRVRRQTGALTKELAIAMLEQGQTLEVDDD